MKDYTAIALAYHKTIRIYAATSTHLVEKARKIHKTFPTTSAALGRFLTASAMMSLMYKAGETLSLRIEGDGPIGFMMVEAKEGIVKGDISNPYVYLKYEDGPKKGKLNVGAAVGKGYLHVTKDLGLKERFTSSTHLTSGEIADDFTYYFASSEQTPSSVGLGVLVNRYKTLGYAGGYILQVLPGCNEEILTKIESQLAKVTSITDLLQAGKTPEDIIHLLADGTEEILETREIAYHCDCTKTKIKKSLSLLDANTLLALKNEDHGAEIICNFCKKKYFFNESDLNKMIENKQK